MNKQFKLYKVRDHFTDYAYLFNTEPLPVLSRLVENKTKQLLVRSKCTSTTATTRFLQFQLPVKQTVLEKKSTREKKKKKLKRLRLNSMNSNELQTKNPFLNNSHACTVVLSLSSDV